MKRSLFRLPGLLAMIALLFAYATAPGTAILQNNWVKLANRTVNYTMDHSEMVVDGLNDNLNGLRVKVTKGAINLHRCVVYYQNAQTQDIDILNSIPEGSESKIIDLPRSDQAITKLVFVYDTKNRAIQKADVEVWGRK
jgi:hypothetical protein